MKYFLRRSIPPGRDVLVIESGSPLVARRVLGEIQRLVCGARFHVLTCWSAPPDAPYTSVFRAGDYPSDWDKLRLLFSLRKKRWPVLAILCTGEPVMLTWKVLALLLLPAKVLVVNENADFFWLDRAHGSNLRAFIASRWGVRQGELLLTLLRALVFPATFLFLVANAGVLLLRRGRRLALWKAQEWWAKRAGS